MGIRLESFDIPTHHEGELIFVLSQTSVEQLTEFTTPPLTTPSTTPPLCITPLWSTTLPPSTTPSITPPWSTMPPFITPLPTATPPPPTATTPLTLMRHQSTTVQFVMLLSPSRSALPLSRPSVPQSSSPSRRSLMLSSATPSPELSARSASRSSTTRSAPTPTPRRPRTPPPRLWPSPSRGSATPRW